MSGKKPSPTEYEDQEPEAPKANPVEQLFDPTLVAAFANNYMSVDSENIATTVMTRGMIREYFGAYSMERIGDPIHLYIKELASHGFIMRPSFSGELALFLRFHSKDCEDAHFKTISTDYDEDEAEPAEDY